MSIRVIIPGYFQRFTDGRDTTEVNGTTVGECLQDLVKQFPRLENVLFYEDGELNDHIWVSINREVVSYWEKPLSRSVLDGDELLIMLFGIAGG